MGYDSDVNPFPFQGIASWGWDGTDWKPTIIDESGHLQVDLTDATISKLGGSLSSPPSGYFKVTNIYVNPDNGKLVITYDDTPVL